MMSSAGLLRHVRRFAAKATFKTHRLGELPLANQLLAAIRVAIANDDRAAAAAPGVEPPTASSHLAVDGHVALRAKELATAQVDETDWSAVASFVEQFGARCDVALVAEWLRARRFALATAYAGDAACSVAARNRIVSGLLRAELYSEAFPFVLDSAHGAAWCRATLHDVIAAVGTVQLNELSIADFFSTALASDEKIRKRRSALLESVLQLFRQSQCFVNDQTTLAVTRAWFTLEGANRPAMPEAWERIEALLHHADPSRHKARGAPVNCPTLVFLAAQVRRPDELVFVEALAASKHVPIGGDLCIALVRASLSFKQVENARKFVQNAGLRLSSDAWAQVITVFDQAGKVTIAMQLLFQQEQSWSLPSRNACTRMLLAIARKTRSTVVKHRAPAPVDVPQLAHSLDSLARASPTAIQMLMSRAGYPYNARVVNAMVRANASSLWTAAMCSPLRYAQERNFRLDHITFHAAIGANFSIGNMGAAFVLWRWYAQTYPQLHGAYLEKSVQVFMISQGLYHQVGRLVAAFFAADDACDVPIVEWRWRTGNAADMASLDLFCEAAAVPLRTKPSAVKKYALQHLAVESSETAPPDFATAYARFQKQHHASRRSQHARDNSRRHRLHPRVGELLPRAQPIER